MSKKTGVMLALGLLLVGANASFAIFADEYRDGVILHADRSIIPQDVGDVIHQIPSPETDYSVGLTWDGQYLWVNGGFDSMIYQVDPTDGTVITSYQVSISSLRGMTWDGGHLWVSSWSAHEIYKLDPSDGSIIESFPAPFSGPANGPNGLAWDNGLLWISESDGQVYKVNPVDGSIVSSFVPPADPYSFNPRGLAWDGNHIWAGYQSTGMIYQLDPTDGSVIASFSSPSGPDQQGLTWDGQYLWSTGGDNVIYQIDVTSVGGTMTGMNPIGALCSNRTTGQNVPVPLLGNPTVDCEANGLLVQPGDVVRIVVFGPAG